MEEILENVVIAYREVRACHPELLRFYGREGTVLTALIELEQQSIGAVAETLHLCESA